MSTRTTIILCIAIIAISTMAGMALTSRLPDPMPSHWNATGEVDGYMSRFWGIFLMPIITTAMFLLFITIPNIDPLRANIAQFRNVFNLFIVLLMGYMAYIYALTLAASLGAQFNMGTMMLPAMGILFVAVGFMVGQAKRNFFIGIRTPWTLSSDTVWDKTHRLGKWTFIAAGIICILSTFLGPVSFWIMMVAIMVAAFIPVIYSYIAWAQENKA
jgi:uncharacterized membrane protein